MFHSFKLLSSLDVAAHQMQLTMDTHETGEVRTGLVSGVQMRLITTVARSRSRVHGENCELGSVTLHSADGCSPLPGLPLAVALTT